MKIRLRPRSHQLAAHATTEPLRPAHIRLPSPPRALDSSLRSRRVHPRHRRISSPRKHPPGDLPLPARMASKHLRQHHRHKRHRQTIPNPHLHLRGSDHCPCALPAVEIGFRRSSRPQRCTAQASTHLNAEPDAQRPTSDYVGIILVAATGKRRPRFSHPRRATIPFKLAAYRNRW